MSRKSRSYEDDRSKGASLIYIVSHIEKRSNAYNIRYQHNTEGPIH